MCPRYEVEGDGDPALFRGRIGFKFELPPGAPLSDSTDVMSNNNSRWMVKRLERSSADHDLGVTDRVSEDSDSEVTVK